MLVAVHHDTFPSADVLQSEIQTLLAGVRGMLGIMEFRVIAARAEGRVNHGKITVCPSKGKTNGKLNKKVGKWITL